jgi:plastocyanin
MRSYIQRSASVGLCASLIFWLTVLVPAQGKHGKGTDDAIWEATTAVKDLNEAKGTPDMMISIDLPNKTGELGNVSPYICSEPGNNAPSLAPESIEDFEVAGRTDLWSLADLKAAPADAGLPGTEGDAAKPGAPAVVKVSMGNMQFSPKTLRVKKGTVVEWTNDDIVPHTVTSASFDSSSLGPGKSWRHMFTEAGQVRYVCTFHPTMTGVVIVK